MRHTKRNFNVIYNIAERKNQSQVKGELRTQDGGDRKIRAQRHPQLQGKSEASLGHVWLHSL